uniref:CXXC-type domain-containing protein n=1 Tax=Caenorhabditis tropicalis TaxID=1561998 RepID=A0A1I7TT44_9PELO
MQTRINVGTAASSSIQMRRQLANQPWKALAPDHMEQLKVIKPIIALKHRTPSFQKAWDAEDENSPPEAVGPRRQGTLQQPRLLSRMTAHQKARDQWRSEKSSKSASIWNRTITSQQEAERLIEEIEIKTNHSPHQQCETESVIKKLDELEKDVGQIKSDIKASRVLQAATLAEVESIQIRLDEESEKRKEVVKLLKLRIKESAPTGGQAPEDAEGLKDGAIKAACVLCRSTTHALTECNVFPTGSSRSAEFHRRNLCRRCAMAGCNLQTCPKQYIVCELCAAAGICEDRSVRHLEGVCEEGKRMKAAKRVQHPPERRNKRVTPQQQQGEKKRAQAQPSQPEGPEMPTYLPIQAPQARQQLVYFLPNNHQMQYPQGVPVQLGQPGMPQQHQQVPMQLQQQGPYHSYEYQ